MFEPSQLFKKFDIRGAYGSEINEDFATLIGLAYYNVMKPVSVCIGYDSLKGSDSIAFALSKSLTRLRVYVTDIGMVATPQLYFAGQFLNFDHSLMITASHLGEGYTGVKFLYRGLPNSESDVLAIKQEFLRCLNAQSFTTVGHDTLGKIEKKDITNPYIRHLKGLIKTELTRYKVVFDTNNGPNSKILDAAIADLGLHYVAINTEIRKEDLSHKSNPKIPENREQLKKAVIDSKAGLGVIWDGDCDRAYFVDSNGEVIAPEFIGIKIAEYLMNNFSYKKFTCDIRASNAVELESEKLGLEVKRIKAWTQNIKIVMSEDRSVGFGMETSGHYVFKDFFRADDGLLASLIFIASINQSHAELAVMLKKFRESYYILEEINFEAVKSEDEVIAELKALYPDATSVDFLDGITITYPTWRFNLRSSQTEPILRLNISGTSKDEVDMNLKKISGVVTD